ncbi:DUF2304 domain-containing protein [Bdellovibrionota bacterium FG-2]
MTFKFVILGFIILGTLLAFLLRKHRLIRPLTAFGLLMLMGAVLLELLFYREFDAIANSVGVERSADLIVYLSIPLLFTLILKLYINQILNLRRTNRLISELALRDARESSPRQ